MKTFSPSEIIKIYTSRIDSGEKSIMLLQGKYKQNAKNGKSYGGYFYDQVISELEDQVSIKIKVPEIMRPKLKGNEIYSFQGILENKVRNYGCLELQFSVTGGITHEKRQVSEKEQKKNDILKIKSEQPFKDLESAIKKSFYNDEKFNLLIVYGKASIVDKDVKSALENAIVDYNIIEERINFSSKNDIIKYIKNEKFNFPKKQAIAFVRGGGTGIEIFDDPNICEELLKVKGITVSVIGHKDDHSFFDSVADRSFPTPSLFGTFLKNMVESVQEEKTNSKAQLIKSIEKTIKLPYENEIKSLKKISEEKERLFHEKEKAFKNKYPSMKRIIIISVVAAAAFVTFGIVLGKFYI